MDKRGLSFGAAVTGLALLAGCSGGGPSDAGDSGIDRDSGPEVCADAGYCSVCHVMTSCNVEYPAGPYGMLGNEILPPCFMGTANWNPTGLWIFDGGNPQFASNEPLFQDLFCAGQVNHQRYALIQMVITSDRNGRAQATDLAQCIVGPQEQWLASGGQVMQIIEQSDMGLAPSSSDLISWCENYNTNYSLGADDDQVLLNQTDMDATNGWPVTYAVDLKTMKILKAHSYGADWGQIQEDFTGLLDSGIIY